MGIISGGFQLIVSLIILGIMGAIIGAIANAIVPGRAPGGLLGAILVGFVGAIIGGFIPFGPTFFGIWILPSILAAIVLVLILNAMGGRRTA
jgi:uncharacterized membrane protein YeaQ/YmgE (transglycosylase-associated protein family)